MDYPPQDLYPVVQDLTEAEYSIHNNHNATNPCCCTDVFGSFSLGDLVMPTTKPRSLPMSPKTLSKSQQQQKQGQHKRGSSLFNFTLSSPNSSLSENKHHRRSHSSPTSISEETTTSANSITTSLSVISEERVTGTLKFEDTFVLTRQIYRCNVSSIWECVNREEGTRHCVKIIDRRRFNSSEDDDSALKEIATMTFLSNYADCSSNPQLTQVVQVTEDLHHYYIVMDLKEGTNLANALQERRRTGFAMSESEVQRLARSMLSGIQQLHDLGVCHYDLQPDNILLEHSREDQVVICDFGSARFVNGEEGDDNNRSSLNNHRRRRRRRRSLQSQLGGNLNYAAPEVLAKHNAIPTLASDMWSVGVILYQCLCGSLPFDDAPPCWNGGSNSNSSTSSSASSRARLKDNIVKANYNFCRKEWSFITRGAKQFVSSLLHPDPMVRLTVAEALDHPWLTMESPPLLVSPSPPKSKRKRRSLVKRVLGTISKRSGLSPEKCEAKDFDLTTASTLSSVGSMDDVTRRRHLYA